MKTIVLCFVAGLTVCYGGTIATNEMAPDFTLTDANGQTHSLQDYRGKYVVLEWVNYGCPFVKKHYASGNMQKLQQQFTEKGVVWLAICSSAKGKQGHFSPEEAAKTTKANKAHSSAYLLDEDGKVGKTYGARTTPHMFVIDPNGKLIYQGAIDSIRSTDQTDIPKADNYVQLALQSALAGKDIATQETQPYGCSVKY